MARIDTLTNFLTDVADSIRNKTGKSETIAAEDFDTEIESIETGGGGNVPIFSTTEIVVGTWTNNKPLYMKTLIGNITANSSGGFNITLPTNISDSLDLIFLGENSFFTTVDGESYPVNYLYTNASGSVTSLIKTRPTKNNKTVITLCYGSLFQANSIVNYTFNLFYVKTTDSIIENPSDVLGNNFSTDEHLVGIDIDGTEIYEKTLNVINYSYGEGRPVNKAISHNINNANKIWIANGSFAYSSASSKRETFPLQYFNHYQNIHRQTSYVNVNKTQIKLFAGDWMWNPGTIYYYITLRYTKEATI